MNERAHDVYGAHGAFDFFLSVFSWVNRTVYLVFTWLGMASGAVGWFGVTGWLDRVGLISTAPGHSTA